jgi:signal transduction histidine kinase
MKLEADCAGVILVVDDLPSNLQVLFTCLENAGFRVLVAKKGVKALAIAESVRPDLILLDILMPDLDGYETCTRLKASAATKDLPVIFMTAYSDTVDQVKCFAVGGVDYIAKPFHVEEVLARIEHQLTIRSLQKQLQQQNAELEQRVRERTAELQREISDRQQAQEALHLANTQLEQRVRERTAQLEAAKEKAEAADRAKSEFLAKMTHELRTPLNAVLGFTQILSRSANLSDEQRQKLEIILSSGEHLLSLINDILQLSKIEAGKTELHLTNFDLNRLADSLKQMLQLKTQVKDLQLNFAIDPAVPRYLRADEGKLRQVLLNLLDNAIKFTDTGSVTLRVGLEHQNDEFSTQHSAPIAPCSLHFEVQDTGQGIAPEDLARIFEAFVQSEAGHKACEGTGLGLAISKHFIELMGGQIQIDSALNEGTTASFAIAATPVQAKDVPPARAQRAVGLAPNQPEYRILVVEDRWENRKLAVQMLSPLGFTVIEANNGREGVEMWEKHNPQLILMDLRMPVMDGYEATQKIKATLKGQATAIIALTATVFDENKNAILTAGCDDFICKPFREEVLLEKIAQLLGVRYVYETTQPQVQPEACEFLTLVDLQVMPRSWLSQLHWAAIACDREEIARLIERIPGVHNTLRQQIGCLVEEFHFPVIAQLTESFVEPTRSNP